MGNGLKSTSTNLVNAIPGVRLVLPISLLSILLVLVNLLVLALIIIS